MSISTDNGIKLDPAFDPNYKSKSENKLNSTLKKIGEMAYEILGYAPVVGTFIGAHHAYKAMNSEATLSDMQKFKIIAQLFSFLIVPQVAYGIARVIENCMKPDFNIKPYEYSQGFPGFDS